jgi:flagellar biosynthetic protein FliQ
MDVQSAADLINSSLQMALGLMLPVLLVLFVVGLAVSVLQAMTQVQDQTLSLVPRLVVGALVLTALLPWMLDRLSTWTVDLYRHIPV